MSESEAMSLDAIFEDFNPDEPKGQEKERCRPLSIWLPDSYWARFGELQDRTNKDFGKRVKKLVMTAIDRWAKSESKAS